MAEDGYKKFVANARRGIRGEAFFEALFCEHAIPHRISGPKDLGLDYICEWVHEDEPTGVLFGAQVKTTAIADVKVVDARHRLNGLERCRIRKSGIHIDAPTLTYWQALAFPVYLFVLVERDGEIDCLYRRTSAQLTRDAPDAKEDGYFRVNRGTTLLAFGSGPGEGFARDLFIDHVRWSYSRGAVVPLDPARLGLRGFPSNAVFGDLFQEYGDSIARAFVATRSPILFSSEPIQASPNDIGPHQFSTSGLALSGGEVIALLATRTVVVEFGLRNAPGYPDGSVVWSNGGIDSTDWIVESSFDMAFRASFTPPNAQTLPVSEPSTTLLVGIASIVALLALRSTAPAPAAAIPGADTAASRYLWRACA